MLNRQRRLEMERASITKRKCRKHKLPAQAFLAFHGVSAMVRAARAVAVASCVLLTYLHFAPTKAEAMRRGRPPLHWYGYPPSGRSRPREMMWRCTSLVPSHMRSIRASRQMRSSGKSLMRPMPP
jgi:hypothetical protein